jgi:hypothetical protein
MKSVNNKNVLSVLTLIIFFFDFSCVACTKINSANKVQVHSRNNLRIRSQTSDPEDKELKELLKEDYPAFVKDLGVNIKDQKFRAAIRSLSELKKVNTENLAVPVLNLIPTQNEVDVDKSLKFPLTSASSARMALFCSEPIRILNSPIVTAANGRYVIDGHHRWSQTYAVNPKCEMASLDLTDIKNPINALKSTQLAIASGKDKDGKDITTIPFATVQGKNLLKIGESDLKEYVVKTLKDDVLEVFKEFKSSLDTKEKVADYIWENVSEMQKSNQPIEGAPGRGVMPQTDLAPFWFDHAINTDKVLPKNCDSSKK